MRFLKLLLAAALLSSIASEAKAAAVFALLTPGHMTASPFLFQIKAHQRAGFVQYHIRIISTSSAKVFDKNPNLSLSLYDQGKNFESLKSIQPVSANRHQDSLDCSFKVPVRAVKNRRLCFEFEHDPGLDWAPHLPSSMPGVILFVARLKDFAPHSAASTQTRRLRRLGG